MIKKDFYIVTKMNEKIYETSKWKKVSEGGSIKRGFLESSYGLPLCEGKTSLPISSIDSSPIADQYIMLSKVKIQGLFMPDTLLEVGKYQESIQQPYFEFNGGFKKGKLLFLANSKQNEISFREFKQGVQELLKLEFFKNFQNLFCIEGLPDEYRDSIKHLMTISPFGEWWYDKRINIFGKRKYPKRK